MEAPDLLRGRKTRWPVPRARGEARRSVVPLVNPKDLTVSRYEHTCGPPTLDAHVTASEAAVLTQGLIVP